MTIDEIIKVANSIIENDIPCSKCPYQNRCAALTSYGITCEASLATIIVEELTKRKESLNSGV